MAAAPSLATAAVAADPTRERSRWSSLFSSSNGNGIKRFGGGGYSSGKKSKKAQEERISDDDDDKLEARQAVAASQDQVGPASDEHALSPAGSTSSRRGSKQPSLQEEEARRRGSDQEQDEITPAGAEENEEADNDNDDDDDAGDQDAVDAIHFYRRDQPYFWLSNSSDHAIYLDGVRYPTAEHLFQALKFLPQRPDIATKVRKASSPSDAIKEARKNIAEVKRGWIGKGLNVSAMREVLLLKFSQHSALRRQLLLTGDAEIVEASPTDAFWGNASRSGGGIALGRNELGKALQRTRETIFAQAGLGIGSGAKTV